MVEQIFYNLNYVINIVKNAMNMDILMIINLVYLVYQIIHMIIWRLLIDIREIVSLMVICMMLKIIN